MHFRAMTTTAALLIAALPIAPLGAQSSGGQGRDWDEAAFSLGSGQVAVVTAANVTQNAGNGNRAGFEIYVNGVRRLPDYSIDRAEAALAFVVGPGVHNVQVRCTNRVATARSCRVSVMRPDEGGSF
jgi:hypothetical protein